MKILGTSIILCLLLLYPNYAFSQTKTNLSPHPLLTKQEKQWIKAHPIIHACVEKDWAPFSYIDANGDISGLSKDYLDTLAKISGLTVKYHYNHTWKGALEKTKNGECDILNGLYHTKQRIKYMHFTMPYLTLNEYFFTRKETKTIYHMEELEYKKIALVKGYATSNWIKKNYPNAHIVEKNSIAECLYSVLSKESDVFIGDNPSTLYNLEQNLITGIKINNTYSEVKPRKLLMGVKKSYPLLASILTKSILSMDEMQEKELKLKWMNISNKETIDLTKKERLWLKTNPEITYTFDPSWKPFEWKNNLQQHLGVLYDIMKHLEKRSGIKLNAKPSADWSSAIDKVKSGEVSIISGIGVTKERKKHLHFSSKSLFLLPYVFVVQKTNYSTNNFNDIQNKRIIVLKDSTIASILTKKYPYIRPHVVSTVEEGFEHLERHKSDLFIVNHATAKYYIDVLRHDKLKISYKTPYILDLKLAFHKNIAPEAMTILNKALQTFDKQDLDNISYWRLKSLVLYV